MVAQDDGEHGGGELEDLSGVHWALELLIGVGFVGSLADGEEVLAEIVCLLEESLLSEVVFDILEVAIGDRELS